mgnify:CR=1 FL=1
MLFHTKLFFKKHGRIVMVWACILIAAISFSVPFLQSAAISNLQSTEIDRIQNLTAEDLKRNAEEANVTFDYSQVQSISPAAIAEAALNRVQSYALGMIAIPDLDPNKLEVIGNGYYSDGTNTYYCSPVSERNKDLSIISELFQITINVFSKNKKPQTYIYPYKKVETNKKLRAVKNMFSFATDGKKVYYN